MEGLEAQVVVSLGGLQAEEFDLPDNVLMILNGGTTSVLEALSNGVPMLVLPVAHDNFGVAARVEWTGTGLRLPLEEVNTESVRRAVDRLLTEPGFAREARRFQQEIEKSQGLNKAADIVEQVLSEL